MNFEVNLTVDADSADVMKTLFDLETYPHWLSIVSEAMSDPNDPGAYDVTIKAQLGPIARAKKLRMVRSKTETDDAIRIIQFERHETHGREVANWKMQISLASESAALPTDVRVELSYDGDLWNPMLETIVRSQVSKTALNLETYIKESK